MLAGKKIVNQKLTIAISLTLAIGSTAVTASTHTEKQIHHAAEDAIEEVLVWGRASKQIGDAPLVEDDSIAHSSTTIVNAGISHSWDNWEVGVDVFNLFDAQGDDIAYYFESQLANEINPVADSHFHPILPRTARATIKWQIR